jgi:CMP-N-acetylneuraminic acid synthetase
MFAGLSVLAVVPARGGSKGVPLKNIRNLWGKPLIAHTAQVVSRCAFIDEAVVSTDHEEIARVAEAHGLAAPFRRPEELSGDRVGDVEVLIHALEWMETAHERTFDVVVMLQPTCPQRVPQHVEQVLELLAGDGRDCVWTVSPTDLKYHPLKALSIDPSGLLKLYDPKGGSIIARQQLVPTYHRNGAAYAIRRDWLLNHRSILSPNSSALVIPDQIFSLDSEEEFLLLETLKAASTTDCLP